MQARTVDDIVASINVLKRAGVTQQTELRMPLLEECCVVLLAQQAEIKRLQSGEAVQ